MCLGTKQTSFACHRNLHYVYIRSVYKRFKAVNPDIVPEIMTNQLSSTFKMPHRDIENMVEFKVGVHVQCILYIVKDMMRYVQQVLCPFL